jgi:hypothetical protein
MRVLFQDEGRFGRISDARSCWAPLPLRPSVGSQLVREYVYAYVAVCPADGQMSSICRSIKDSLRLFSTI